MTTLIVDVPYIDTDKLDRILDDFFEAIEYEKKTGFVTRVVLERFRNDKPVYKPLKELTWIEGWIEWQGNVIAPVENAQPADGMKSKRNTKQEIIKART